MKGKIWEGKVTASEEEIKIVKRILINHVLLYNYNLRLYNKDPYQRLESITSKTFKYAKVKCISPIIEPAIHNELYYQYKKLRKNVKLQKQFTDVQYITLVSRELDNTMFSLNKEGTEFVIKSNDLVFHLEEPAIIDNPEKSLLYFNLSYSPSEESFRLNIHKN